MKPLGMNRIMDNLKDSAYEIQRKRAELVEDRQALQSHINKIDEEIADLDRGLEKLGETNRVFMTLQRVRVAAEGVE